jgi:hypothetical protein
MCLIDSLALKAATHARASACASEHVAGRARLGKELEASSNSLITFAHHQNHVRTEAGLTAN